MAHPMYAVTRVRCHRCTFFVDQPQHFAICHVPASERPVVVRKKRVVVNGLVLDEDDPRAVASSPAPPSSPAITGQEHTAPAMPSVTGAEPALRVAPYTPLPKDFALHVKQRLEPPPPERRRYQCSDCEYTSSTGAGLAAHRRGRHKGS